jgi:hypothetical protein
MVDNRSGAPVQDGLGKKGGWVPWLIGALVVIGGLTAIDLAFYRDDIHDEAHEESEDHSEEEGDETDTDLVEPGGEDEGTDDSES